jgi:hypothetical protein
LRGSKLVKCKSGGLERKGCSDRQDAMVGRIGPVSHHLGSLLGAIELTVSCAFVCRVGYLDAQTFLERCNSFFLGVGNLNRETTCIPHHVLYSISEKRCVNFKPLLLTEST